MIESSSRDGGRPAKWADPRVREALVDGVRMGAPVKYACRAAGIDEGTFYRWRRQSAEPEAPEELRALFEELEGAHARAVLRNVGLIQAAAQESKHWKAAAWWLERMHPEDFARQDPGQLGQGGTQVVIASEDDIRRLQATLERRAEASGELAVVDAEVVGDE